MDKAKEIQHERSLFKKGKIYVYAAELLEIQGPRCRGWEQMDHSLQWVLGRVYHISFVIVQSQHISLLPNHYSQRRSWTNF